MPRNIELKAAVESLDRARELAYAIATEALGILNQIDTYFHAPLGRLKLREIAGKHAELIAYHRADASDPRPSDYTLVAVADPVSVRKALASTLGVWKVVEKRREVLLWNNVRIHLDSVKGLGTFLEFESVLTESLSAADGHEQLVQLQSHFGIQPGDCVANSYADLA